jgi:hypothetical protein
MADMKLRLILEAVDNASTKLENFQKVGLALTGMATAMATAFATATKMAMNYGEEMLRISKITGESVENITALAFAAEQSETSIQTVTMGLGILAKNMLGASQGSKEMKEKFQSMGISIYDAEGKMKSSTQVLMEMSDFMKNSGRSSTEKMALAMELLGRGGKELMPIMKEGSAGIKGLMEEAKALGVVIDEKTARSLDDMGDELSKVKTGMLGVALTIAKELTPYIQETTKSILDLIKGFQSLSGEEKSLQLGMIMFTAKIMGVIGALLLLIGYFPKIVLGLKAVGAAMMAMPLVGIAIAVAGVTTSIVEYLYQVERAKNRNMELVQTKEQILQALIKENQAIKEQISTGKLSVEEGIRLTNQYKNQKVAIDKLTIEVENEKKAKEKLGKANKDLLKGMSMLEAQQESGYQAFMKNEEALVEQEKAAKSATEAQKKFNDTVEDWVRNKGNQSVKMSEANAAAFITMAQKMFESGVTLQNTFSTVVDGISRMFDPVTGAAIQLGGSIINKLLWGKKKPEEVIDENYKAIDDYLNRIKIKWGDLAVSITTAMADALQVENFEEGWSGLLKKIKSTLINSFADMLSGQIISDPKYQGIIQGITQLMGIAGKGVSYSYVPEAGKPGDMYYHPAYETGDMFNGQYIKTTENLWAIISSLGDQLKDLLGEQWGGLADLIAMFGGSLDMFDIPSFGTGGIVTRPTLALIGESGAEAVVPLDKMNSGVTVNFSGVFMGSKSEMDTAFRKYMKPALDNYLAKTGVSFG